MGAVVLAVLLGAAACSAAGDTESATATTEATRRSPTSTTARPSTSTTAADTTTSTGAPTTAAEPVPADDGVLRTGSSGEAVRQVQQRLSDLRFDPGPVDGNYGTATMQAVRAFQKIHGLAADGSAGPETLAKLAEAGPPAPLVPGGGPTRVEVDLDRQVLFLYVDGGLRLITHVSTGSGIPYCENGHCGDAQTPPGSYRFYYRYPGWQEGDLGKLYNPVYFNGGIAVHGSTSVPDYPASHGCVRIPMHIAEYFPNLVRNGDPVYVVGDGVVPSPAPPATEPPAPPEATPIPAPAPSEVEQETAPPPSTTTTAPPPTTAAPTTTPAEPPPSTESTDTTPPPTAPPSDGTSTTSAQGVVTQP